MAEITNKVNDRIAETDALAAFDQLIQDGMSQTDALRSAISNFPDQAELLSDYAVHLSAVGFEGNVDESSLSFDALDAFDRIASTAQARARGAVGELSGILSQARTRGIDSAHLAATLRLGKSVLSKLDQRLISLATIPGSLIQQIAREIGVQSESVRNYLAGSPRLAAGASYKSNKTPAARSRQQNFDIALNAAVRLGEMSDGDRALWLDPPGDQN